MSDQNSMPKKEELDRKCAEKGWAVEGRAGGKNVGEETDK